MAHFAAIVIRWVSDEPQPGLIELSVVDAFGRDHRILEKDIVTPVPIGKRAAFPVTVWLEAEPRHTDGDEVTMTLPWSMSTMTGETELTMARSTLRP